MYRKFLLFILVSNLLFLSINIYSYFNSDYYKVSPWLIFGNLLIIILSAIKFKKEKISAN